MDRIEEIREDIGFFREEPGLYYIDKSLLMSHIGFLLTEIERLKWEDSGKDDKLLDYEYRVHQLETELDQHKKWLAEREADCEKVNSKVFELEQEVARLKAFINQDSISKRYNEVDIII